VCDHSGTTQEFADERRDENADGPGGCQHSSLYTGMRGRFEGATQLQVHRFPAPGVLTSSAGSEDAPPVCGVGIVHVAYLDVPRSPYLITPARTLRFFNRLDHYQN
jgi:hypothetical protein